MRVRWFTSRKTRLQRALAIARYYGEVKRSGLFDADYYLAHHDDVKKSGLDPLRHYLVHGGFEGRNPCSWFFSDFYLYENRDVRESGVNPLVHFLRRGDQEGRRPNPCFDPKWYRTRNKGGVPDAINSLEHFIREGFAKDFQTCDPEEIDEILKTNDGEARRKGALEDALKKWREGIPYSKWIELFDTPSANRVANATQIKRFADESITFLIFLVLSPENESQVRVSLRSLFDQRYRNWEVVIVTNDRNRDAARMDELQDTRCSLASVEEAFAHITKLMSNPSGRTFCTALTAGDCLRAHTLLQVVHALESSPEAEVIYSDEDTRLKGGKRVNPVFKPDWDPLLFSSVDYLGSSAFVDVRLLDGITEKAFNEAVVPDISPSKSLIKSFLGIELTDLERRNVLHLAEILFHTTEASAYSRRMTRSVEWDIEQFKGLAAQLYGEGAQSVAPDSPLVSLVIPTKKNSHIFQACIRSILEKTVYPHFEIVIVDNDAEQETKEFLSRLRRNERCKIVVDEGPFNFSALINRGVENASGELVCLLNDDVEIDNPQWLDALVAFGKHTKVGAVGAVLRYPDETIQHGGVILGGLGIAAHSFVGCESADQSYMRLAAYPREVSAVTGACLLVEKEKYLSVGGLDEAHLKVNFNDIDLCLKLTERGLSNIVLPLSGLIHHESKSRGSPVASAEKAKQLNGEAECMRDRWQSSLQRDPFYNRNLSLRPILYQLSTSLDVQRDEEERASSWVEDDYRALEREPRLNIYKDESNEKRAYRASHLLAPPLQLKETPRGLSLIVLNKDAPDLIGPLVQSLVSQQPSFEADGLGFEILIGDTGSTDPETLTIYRNLPSFARLTNRMKYNFSACNNELEERASFDTALFLNNDIIFPPDEGVLKRAFEKLHTSGEGILGAVLLYPGGRIQHMGCHFLTNQDHWGLPFHPNTGKRPSEIQIPEENQFPAVTGAFLMIPRYLFRLCGRFDPDYQAECQDIALCLEAHRRGVKATCFNLGPIIHIENATRPKGEENWADRRRFLRKYGAYIQGAFL